MLELRNLAIRDPIALSAQDMTLEKGKSYALIGPSGVGKSTLFQVLAGFNDKFSGEIIWQGQTLNNERPSQRPISYLFQRHNLFTHLTLRENIALGLSADLKLSKSQWSRVDRLMEELKIADQAKQLPRELSGGQDARGAIARVILQGRDIVLFDEPFSTLGPAQTEEIRGLVKERLETAGRILIFVTHQLENISLWADEIIWAYGGNIHAPIVANQFFVNDIEGVKHYFGAQFKGYM